MTRFIHKNGVIEITYSEYQKLSDSDKNDFQIVNASQAKQVTNTTNISHNTDDLLGIGKVAETTGTIALMPIAIVASLFK